MFVIRKKQIVFTTVCVLVSIFTFMFTSAKFNNTNTTAQTKETVSLPVSRKNNCIRCWSRRPR